MANRDLPWATSRGTFPEPDWSEGALSRRQKGPESGGFLIQYPSCSLFASLMMRMWCEGDHMVCSWVWRCHENISWQQQWVDCALLISRGQLPTLASHPTKNHPNINKYNFWLNWVFLPSRVVCWLVQIVNYIVFTMTCPKHCISATGEKAWEECIQDATKLYVCLHNSQEEILIWKAAEDMGFLINYMLIQNLHLGPYVNQHDILWSIVTKIYVHDHFGWATG